MRDISIVLLYSFSLLSLINPITTVSSAYFMILQFSELNDRALVYTMNKNADKTHPLWGSSIYSNGGGYFAFSSYILLYVCEEVKD